MRSKTAKLPALSPKTKFLSFDLETNGLHGKAFALSALVIDKDGTVHDEFNARTEINEPIDEWVASNVIPFIDDMQITHGSYKAMCDAFWRWFVAAQEKSDYVLVSNGYPVEYRFLLDCQELAIDERYWEHPFPIIDVTSLILLQGDSAKKQIKKQLKQTQTFRPHHPRDDAKMAALLAFEAIKLSGSIQ